MSEPKNKKTRIYKQKIAKYELIDKNRNTIFRDRKIN